MLLIHMDDGTLLITEPVQKEGFSDPLRIFLGTTGVVRYWGTTKGRGQLALDGPQDKTIVDVEPEGGEVNWLHVRRIIPVSKKAELKWLAFLKR